MTRLLILMSCLVPATARADAIDEALVLLRSPVASMRAQAVLALGTQTRHVSRVVAPLVGRLSDSHRTVRAAAATALGRLGAFEALEALKGAMSDEDYAVADAARRAVPKIVQAFVANRGAFAENRYTFSVNGLGVSQAVGDRTLVAVVKDLALERLLAFPNVDVGVRQTFDGDDPDEETRREIPLDLSGEVVALDGRACTIRLVLALRPGGWIVSRWDAVKATGRSRDEALANAVATGVGRILAFLGAGVR